MVLGFQRLAAWLLGRVMWREFAEAGPREAIQKRSDRIKSLPAGSTYLHIRASAAVHLQISRMTVWPWVGHFDLSELQFTFHSQSRCADRGRFYTDALPKEGDKKWLCWIMQAPFRSSDSWPGTFLEGNLGLCLWQVMRQKKKSILSYFI